jgi:hypothetical protein
MQHNQHKKSVFVESILKKRNRKIFFNCKPEQEINRLFYYWLMALGALLIAILILIELQF